MSAAGMALQTAAAAALRGIAGLGVYDGPPARAAYPYATVDAGLESDWSHKSGAGREVRLAVTLWDNGERAARLHGLVGEAEAALAGLDGEVGGWRLVTMRFVRSRVLREVRGPWAGVVEFRARMLAV